MALGSLLLRWKTQRGLLLLDMLLVLLLLLGACLLVHVHGHQVELRHIIRSIDTYISCK
jgi:hypothetical protein